MKEIKEIKEIENEVKRIIDEYSQYVDRTYMAEDIPEDMIDGEINKEGWVQWKVLPSNLTLKDIQALENKYALVFPPYLASYLKASYHLLDQVQSKQYHGQQIMLPPCPSDNPLEPIITLIDAWSCLLPAGYLPFAEWGDGWGPMCLDLKASSQKTPDDYNIVWFDHDILITLGEEACSERANISEISKPLYDSFKAFFYDVFSSSLAN